MTYSERTRSLAKNLILFPVFVLVIQLVLVNLLKYVVLTSPDTWIAKISSTNPRTSIAAPFYHPILIEGASPLQKSSITSLTDRYVKHIYILIPRGFVIFSIVRYKI